MTRDSKTLSSAKRILNPGEKVFLGNSSINPIQSQFVSEKTSSHAEIYEEEIEDSSFRGFLWTYPQRMINFFNYFRPFSFILVFTLCAVFLYGYLVSLDLDAYSARDTSKFVEGNVGVISSLNPIFVTQNQVDRDIHELVFERLVDIDENAEPIPNIAKSWNVSKDRKVYEFTLRDDLYWHDGKKVTAEDVKFTFDKALELSQKYEKDTIGKSLPNLVTEVVETYVVRLSINEENSTFFESVAIYIVPKHILESLDPDSVQFFSFQPLPVGSGPYRVKMVKEGAVVMERHELFKPLPSIEKFEYRAFGSEDDLEVSFKNNTLDGISNTSINSLPYLEEYPNFTLNTAVIHYRKKLLFINTRNERYKDPALRRALSYITDKNRVLTEVDIEGVPALSPIARNSWAFNADVNFYNFSIEEAEKQFLEAKYGKNEATGIWEKDGIPLEVTLTYFDNDVNRAIGESLQRMWIENGVRLQLNAKNYDQITKEVIAKRDFELLLFEVETTIDPDQYNLWHSLRADYPNLNLSGYSYNRVDILLERARRNFDRGKRIEDYNQAQKYIMNDAPVIFLYEPAYNYIVRNTVVGPDLGNVRYPADRFKDVAEWYVE